MSGWLIFKSRENDNKPISRQGIRQDEINDLYNNLNIWKLITRIDESENKQIVLSQRIRVDNNHW